MVKEKEMWMQKLKEKLGDYTDPVPASGWERLEKELMPPAEKRIIPFHRRWTVAAAAVLLAAASSVSLYFLSSPAADEIRHTSVPVLATAPDVMPQRQEPAMQVAKVTVTVAADETKKMHAGVDLVSEKESIEDGNQRNEGEGVESSIAENMEHVNGAEQASTEQALAEYSKKREARKPSGKDKLHLPEQSSSAKKGGRWSMGASVGNAGAISINNGGDYAGSGPIMQSSQLDMTSATNGVVKIPDGQTVVFKDGVPYLQKTKEVMDIEHRQPVSFGLSVRKELKKGFSVETGVTYTLLSSDVKLGSNNVANDQKLHYVGIPLRANWNFLNNKLVTLYVAAGGAVEKCVYAELAGEKKTVKPLQFSLTGAVGAQINATKRLGVYVEPGVSYFFDDGSTMQTIRKDTPCNFNLQAGVRFTY